MSDATDIPAVPSAATFSHGKASKRFELWVLEIIPSKNPGCDKGSTGCMQPSKFLTRLARTFRVAALTLQTPPVSTQPLFNAWRATVPRRLPIVASVKVVAPVSSCVLCASPRCACRARLRRVGLHRRFHAQGTARRLAFLHYAVEVAKDLKTMCARSKKFSHHHQSLVLPHIQVCLSGLRSFSSLLIHFSDYVERICF
jgi:hypothetical protein